MKYKLLNLISFFLNNALFLLSKMLSKVLKIDNRKIIFGAMYGAYYGDNSRHLYEWILNNRKDLKPIWITKNKDIYQILQKDNKPVTNAKSLEGIIHLLTAKVGVFSNSLNDIAWKYKMVPKSLPLIALRHGRSVKKIRFAREGHKLSEKERKEREFESIRLKFAISTSEFISDLQEECLRIGRNKHIITGYPRNDELYKLPNGSIEEWNSFIGDLKPNKVILYGPSWRHKRYATKFFPFDDFDLAELKIFLEKNKCLLLLRPHRNELTKYNDLVDFLNEMSNSSEMIKLCTHNHFPDVNKLLTFVNVLVSDYSALYHDYLLLDRPMLFIPYDYEDFKEKNGFLYNYFENLPGPAIHNFKSFRKELKLILKGTDNYKKERKELRNKIHKYQDDNSCERVSKLIDKIINNEIE